MSYHEGLWMLTPLSKVAKNLMYGWKCSAASSNALKSGRRKGNEEDISQTAGHTLISPEGIGEEQI